MSAETGTLQRLLEGSMSPKRETQDHAAAVLCTPSRKRALASVLTDNASLKYDGSSAIFSQMQASPASSVTSDAPFSTPGGLSRSSSSPSSDYLTSPVRTVVGERVHIASPGFGGFNRSMSHLLNSPTKEHLTSDFEWGLPSGEVEGDATIGDIGRPDIKRRKTAPANIFPSAFNMPPFESPTYLGSPNNGSPGKRSPEKRGAGKDGQEVWPPEVEAVFFEALQIIPPMGRRKVLVNNKPCGRNELIADFIGRKTGKIRTRKQVSSHIQVLKNMRRDDPEFMVLVTEPLDGPEPVFTEAAAREFGGTLQFCSSPSATTPCLYIPPQPVSNQMLAGKLSAPAMAHSLSDSHLLTPYGGTSGWPGYRSRSPSPMLSPALSDFSSQNGSLPPSPAVTGCDSPGSRRSISPLPTGFESNFSTGMSTAYNDSHAPKACPTMPHQLCMWAKGPATRPHLLCRFGSDGSPRNTVYFEDLDNHQVRFPQLLDTHKHSLSDRRFLCHFMLVKLSVTLPSPSTAASYDTVQTLLQLHADGDAEIRVSTRVYRNGHEEASFCEKLHVGTPLLENCGTHAYTYNAPFAANFWHEHMASYGGQDGELAADFWASTTVVQEYFMLTNTEGSSAEASDRLLIVAYEFVHSSDESTIAFLDARPAVTGSYSSAAVAAPEMVRRLSAQPRRPSMLSQSASAPELLESQEVVVPDIHLAGSPPKQTTLSLPPSKPHRYANKANLSLNIPISSMPIKGETPPVTPLVQMIGTPNAPPPIQQHTEAENKHHRVSAWTQGASNWNMASPALAGAFPSALEPLPSPSYDPNMPTSLGKDHHASTALNHMTSVAIAAGTPIFSTFAGSGSYAPLASSFHHPVVVRGVESTHDESFLRTAINHDYFGSAVNY